jgi:hypothetical protein
MPDRYFPQYFRRTRIYAASLTNNLVSMGGLAAGPGKMESTVMDAITREFAISTSPARASTADYMTLLTSGAMVSEGFAAQSNAEFDIHGRRVYDVDPVLVAELRDSDGDEITIADLRPQFRAFYVHVGAQPDVVFGGGVVFEGAYIVADPIAWRITVCGRRPGRWWERPADVHSLRLPASIFHSPLGEAIDEALKIDKDDLMSAQAKMVRQSPEMSHAVLHVMKGHDEAASAMKQALNLCAQVLAYVISYENDREEAWQEDTPVKMKEKADASASAKERERNRSKLTSMGFWRVIKVGLDFRRAHKRAEESGTREPHTRRAHWRNQAHGPRMSLRKLIWIYRTRVLGR